jgi:uncharacterized protein YhfF
MTDNARDPHVQRSLSRCSSLRVTGWISWCGIVAIPERTPLPEIDRSAAAAFWQRYLATVGEEIGAGYTDVACFGDSVELADELIDLVLGGQKRATAGSLAEYESEGVALPQAGDRWIACDGRGLPRAVIETIEVRVGPLSSVDDQFAWDEGEGDRTRADWLRNHTAYFTRTHASLGIPFHPDIPVAFERFEVAYQEPDQEPG